MRHRLATFLNGRMTVEDVPENIKVLLGTSTGTDTSTTRENKPIYILVDCDDSDNIVDLYQDNDIDYVDLYVHFSRLLIKIGKEYICCITCNAEDYEQGSEAVLKTVLERFRLTIVLLKKLLSTFKEVFVCIKFCADSRIYTIPIIRDVLADYYIHTGKLSLSYLLSIHTLLCIYGGSPSKIFYYE